MLFRDGVRYEPLQEIPLHIIETAIVDLILAFGFRRFREEDSVNPDDPEKRYSPCRAPLQSEPSLVHDLDSYHPPSAGWHRVQSPLSIESSHEKYASC